MPKLYFQNLWVLNYFSWIKINNFDTISWWFIENFVYNCLSDIVKNSEDIYFYRTISKSEIDFIVRIEDRLIAIEVKYRNKLWKTPISIINFEENYKNVSTKILITKNEIWISNNEYRIPFYLLPFLDRLE